MIAVIAACEKQKQCGGDSMLKTGGSSRSKTKPRFEGALYEPAARRGLASAAISWPSRAVLIATPQAACSATPIQIGCSAAPMSGLARLATGLRSAPISPRTDRPGFHALPAAVLQDSERQSDLFYKFVPARMEQEPQKAHTFDEAARAANSVPGDAALARRAQIANEKVNAMRRRISDIESA
jgi:hypothetical protein